MKKGSEPKTMASCPQGGFTSGSMKLSVITNRFIVWQEIRSCVREANYILLTGPFTPATAPGRLEQIQPNVLLLDFRLLQHCPVGPLWEFSRWNVAAQLFLILDTCDLSGLANGLAIGARAFLLRPFGIQDLLCALRLTSENSGVFLTRDLAYRLFENSTNPLVIGASPGQLLTPRQHEVLTLQSEGLQYKEIAERLRISEHTVKNHLYEIHQKVRAHNAIEAINFVFRGVSPFQREVAW
jgi:DNA-binding NarL/FixJ family response regulator